MNPNKRVNIGAEIGPPREGCTRAFRLTRRFKRFLTRAAFLHMRQNHGSGKVLLAGISARTQAQFTYGRILRVAPLFAAGGKIRRGLSVPFRSSRSTTESALGIRLPCGWRIVVIDDHKDTADTLSVLLRLSGNECITAYSGIDGLNLARFHRPEIILLDLNMPKLDGFHTCALIRQEHWSKHVKIIATTGLDDEYSRVRARFLGFDAHILKPVDPEELANVFLKLGCS